VSLGIFSVVPPTEPCALRSTQPLKVGTMDFSWDKGGQCVWLTHKIMNKPTQNKHPLLKIANDALVDLPTPSTIRG